MRENPGAYKESHNRILEIQEKEKKTLEDVVAYYESRHEQLKKKKTLDIFELKRRIETGQSLEGLRIQIQDALKDGILSRELHDKVLAEILSLQKQDIYPRSLHIDANKIPLSQNSLAQFLEKQKIGNHILIDILGVLYGFCIQGSAIVLIIIWKLLVDFLLLPIDIYRYRKNIHSPPQK